MTTLRLEEAAALNYHALSYAWGDRSIMYDLVIDRKVLRVGKNLYDFLRQLHSWSWRGYLWVDALCIDQTNIAERNLQVQIMADIYRRAQTVHVWLGTGVQSLRKSLLTISVNGALYAGDDIFFHGFLKEMASCAYWSRAWVVQELTCASEILLHYADQAIPASMLWDDYLDNAIFKDWFIGDVKQNNPEIQQMLSILRRTSPNPDPELQPFESIIHDFSHQLCSEPRDHIYAFRALYQDRYGDAVPVDYNVSLAELISRALPCCETKTNLHSLFTILNSWEISDQELSRDADRAVTARLCPQLPNPFLSRTEKPSPEFCPLPPPLACELELACVRSSSSSPKAPRKNVFLPTTAAQMISQIPPSSWCVTLLDADYDLMVEAEHRLKQGKRAYRGFPKLGGIAIVAHLGNLDSESCMKTPTVGIWLQEPQFKSDPEQYQFLQQLNYCRRILEDAFCPRKGVSFEYTKRSEISIRMPLPAWNALCRSLQTGAWSTISTD